MGFNSGFKGLKLKFLTVFVFSVVIVLAETRTMFIHSHVVQTSL